MKKKPLLPPAATPAAPELATEAHDGTPQYGNYGHAAVAPIPESAPEPTPDHRTDGGDVFDLRNEQTTL